MKKRAKTLANDQLCSVFRLGGVILSAAPVLLMLVTGLVGTVNSGQLRADVFLPAELFFLTIPGMALMAAAAVKQQQYARISTALPVIAAAALVLCQVLAHLSGTASGRRESRGFLMVLLVGLLVLFDLTAVTAPVVGLLSIRRLRYR